MKCWRRTTVVVLLAAYAAAGFLMETQHSDAVSLKADPALVPHTCGERENHVPLDQTHSCAVCAQSSQRVSTPVGTSVAVPPLRLVLGSVPLELIDVPSTLPTLSDSRGPPPA